MDDYLHLLHAQEMDSVTFDRLMKEYGQEVWNYAYFMTRDYHAADDISQEVFLRVYRNFSGFRGESSVRTWLLRITRNMSLNYRKTAFVRRVFLRSDMSTDKRNRSAEEDVLDQDVCNEIWKIILGLPAPFREVLLLEIQFHYSTKETADLIGVSEGTVKSRLSRARQKVTAALKKAQEKEGLQ
ncbi:sigma-70 family RNA polymerase sigma factor [Gorillibacterium sp. CAU 1737]|uniref:RNA polymerase sigma factor n=1 Tax=Gorillibacterium sp. CAU 1737 TaxID=3140362 RepID=UPI0032611D48